ncbi:MAG: nucleotide exchange factor GrpE [Minisyncoccia bacterium]
MNTQNNTNESENPKNEEIFDEGVETELVDDSDDAVEYEMEDGAVEELGMQAKLKKLRAELKAEKEKSTEYLTGWQTERASFANYKAEQDKNRTERLAGMKLNLIADFFPVLDSFDMAFSNREAWESVDPAWRTGVEYIHTQFMNTLDQYNVEKINALNATFDPMLHEPIDTVATDDQSQNDTIAQIIQSGYVSGHQVIRPAKVKVYKYAE